MQQINFGLVLLLAYIVITRAANDYYQYKILLDSYFTQSPAAIYKGPSALTSTSSLYYYSFGVCKGATNCVDASCSGLVNYQLFYINDLQVNATTSSCDSGISYRPCYSCDDPSNLNLVVTCVQGPCNSNGNPLVIHWVADAPVGKISAIYVILFVCLLFGVCCGIPCIVWATKICFWRCFCPQYITYSSDGSISFKDQQCFEAVCLTSMPFMNCLYECFWFTCCYCALCLERPSDQSDSFLKRVCSFCPFVGYRCCPRLPVVQRDPEAASQTASGPSYQPPYHTNQAPPYAYSKQPRVEPSAPGTAPPVNQELAMER